MIVLQREHIRKCYFSSILKLVDSKEQELVKGESTEKSGRVEHFNSY